MHAHPMSSAIEEYNNVRIHRSMRLHGLRKPRIAILQLSLPLVRPPLWRPISDICTSTRYVRCLGICWICSRQWWAFQYFHTSMSCDTPLIRRASWRNGIFDESFWYDAESAPHWTRKYEPDRTWKGSLEWVCKWTGDTAWYLKVDPSLVTWLDQTLMETLEDTQHSSLTFLWQYNGRVFVFQRRWCLFDETPSVI